MIFAACTAVRIGEVSGGLVGDIDTVEWVWRLRRQTSPGPGGLKDKGTKGKRSRKIPIIEDIRPLVLERIQAANNKPEARLFVGPRGGRIQTGVPLHRLQQIAGHTDPRITQRYLHPDIEALQNDGNLFSIHLRAPQRSPNAHRLKRANPSDRSQKGFFAVGLTGFEPATT